MDMKDIFGELNEMLANHRGRTALVEELAQLRRRESKDAQRIFDLENELEWVLEGQTLLIVRTNCTCGSTEQHADGLIVKRSHRTNKQVTRWSRPPFPQPHLPKVAPIAVERKVDACFSCLPTSWANLVSEALEPHPTLQGVFHATAEAGPQAPDEDPHRRDPGSEGRPAPVLTYTGAHPTWGIQQLFRVFAPPVFSY